ncbi:MAG: type II toxin-antitoxin system HicB family antitoxin [Microcystis sp. LE19-98.1E]|nr:type II toxin-antitoxin system HicB family antitoxin [Microcystis sp. LE19-55.1A]MCZ8307681.1 type II toxin-antitoxin system HicB family antitoxin [Microcystis sp. LE19-98.1E]
MSPSQVTTGKTLEEITENMKEAIQFHLDGLQEEGLPIPQPATYCQYIEA